MSRDQQDEEAFLRYAEAEAQRRHVEALQSRRKGEQINRQFPWCWRCVKPVRPVVHMPGSSECCPCCHGTVVKMPIHQLRVICYRAGWSEQDLKQWTEGQDRHEIKNAENARHAEEQQRRQREAAEAERRRRGAEQAKQRQIQEEAERQCRHEEARRRQHEADEARRQEEQRQKQEEARRRQHEADEARRHEQRQTNNGQRSGGRIKQPAMSDEAARQILGVTATASPDEIQQAYRRLAKQHHPDTHTNPIAKEQAHQQMVRISLAYQILRRQTFRSTTMAWEAP